MDQVCRARDTTLDDAEPGCPHCSEAIREVWFQQLRGFLGKRVVPGRDIVNSWDAGHSA